MFAINFAKYYNLRSLIFIVNRNIFPWLWLELLYRCWGQATHLFIYLFKRDSAY